MRCHRRVHRVAVILGAASVLRLLLPGAVPASADTSSSSVQLVPVQLTGEGTYDVTADMLTWQDALYNTKADPDINLNYVAQGGPTALADLLNGDIQYAISGIPYTASQLASVGGGSNGIIAAPIMPSAVGFLVNPPPGGFYVLNGNTLLPTVYTGALRVPADNLAAQMFNYQASYDSISPSDPNYQYIPYPGGVSPQARVTWTEWDNPDIIGTWDQSFLSQYAPTPTADDPGDVFLPANQGPQPNFQAEANEDTYYMEQWFSQAAPNMWHLLQEIGDPKPTAADPWGPAQQVQANLQRGLVFQPGLSEAITSFVLGTTDNGQADSGGVIAPYPPSALGLSTATAEAANQRYKPPPPGLGFEWASVQNANGDWVAPSPSTIDTAIDSTPAPTPTATTIAPPLFAASNSVPGAYPLTYVDYLYAPAHGLTVAQTEALATAIRYLATDGQNELSATNDGRLPASMVLQALSAANQLVQSNCPKADTVLTATAGPYTPADLPGLNGLGAEYHCEVPASTPATTGSSSKGTTGTSSSGSSATTVAVSDSAGSTTSGSSGSSASGSSASGSSTGTSSAANGSASGGTSTTGSKAGATNTGNTNGSSNASSKPSKSIVAQLASAMPFTTASSVGAGLEKLAALVVGVWLFLLVRRKPAQWLRKVLGD